MIVILLFVMAILLVPSTIGVIDAVKTQRRLKRRSARINASMDLERQTRLAIDRAVGLVYYERKWLLWHYKLTIGEDPGAKPIATIDEMRYITLGVR